MEISNVSAKIKKGIRWALDTIQSSQETKNEVTEPMVNSSLSYLHLKNSERTDGQQGNDGNIRPTFSRQEVAHHCSSQSCWMVMNNKIYDVTDFLRRHPGGEDIILEYAGIDATSAFIDKGHSLGAIDMLSEYHIGEISQMERYPEKNYT